MKHLILIILTSIGLTCLGQKISFVPNIIAPTTEVGNPLKGFHQWNNSTFLSSLPKFDIYERFSWRELEPEKGVYNFEPIDQILGSLEEGQRFAFRIMPLNTCCTNYKNGADVPTYVVNEGRGFFYHYHSVYNSDSIFVPDWNDSILISYMEDIIHTLGERYDGDPRISWLDIGFYGNWAEWHTYPIQYPNSNGKYDAPPPNSTYIYSPIMPDSADSTRQKFRVGSEETKFRILQSQLDAFRHTQLVQSTSDLPCLFKALASSSTIPVGVRRDSWGDPNFNNITKWNNYKPNEEEWLLFNSRWKTAPFIAENWGAAYVGDSQMIDQIDYFHISSIAFGNMGNWNNLPQNQKETYLNCGRHAGYRYQINNVSAQIYDSTLDVELSWINTGISPSYENWKIQAFAINPKTDVLCSSVAELPINLKSIYDASAPSSFTKLSIPLTQELNTDTIQIRIKVTDENNYLKPLNLDLENRNPDGSYTLFSFSNKTMVNIPTDTHFQHVEMFPNPATSELAIYWPESDLEKITLTDMSGKSSSATPELSTNSTYIIDLKHFKPGIYIISLFGRDKSLMNQKLIIKQR